MIDAYEIGIELALQDGVSAGIEVITRELAALDAAVAASAAGLTALMRAADGLPPSVAAVSRSVGGKAAAAKVPVERPDAQEMPSSTRAAAPVALPPAAPAAAVERPATAGLEAAPLAAAARAMNELPVAPAAPIALAVLATPAAVVPPVKRRVDVQPSAEPVQASGLAEGLGSVAPMLEAPTAPVVRRVEHRTGVVAAPRGVSGEGLPAVAPIVPRGLPDVARPPVAPVVREAGPVALPAWAKRQAVGADVSAVSRRVQAAREPDASAGPPAASLGAAETVRGAAPRTVAPVRRGEAAVDRVAPGSRAEEGATRPEASAADKEDGGGSVHLDGHLVGEWLSQRLARDAARPGAGTTFFDPRQAPAWTPSGAL